MPEKLHGQAPFTGPARLPYGRNANGIGIAGCWPVWHDDPPENVPAMHSPSNRDGPSEPHAPQGKDAPETSVIPVIQEEATVSRTTEKTGAALRVRIESREEKQRIPVSEIVEEASVERVAINRYVSERTGVRCEGDVVIVPVFETVPVIEERLLLKEEIRIVRRTRELRREEEVVLHKETPVIERRASEQDNWSEDVPESKP